MDSDLSITVDMLKSVWGKNMDKPLEEYKDNKVKLIHPNGWYFSLGKFRTIPTPNYYRVRMHIQYKISVGNKEEFRCFYSFASMFFGLDLDDCWLDDLEPLLRWCEKYKAEDFAGAFLKQ